MDSRIFAGGMIYFVTMFITTWGANQQTQQAVVQVQRLNLPGGD